MHYDVWIGNENASERLDLVTDGSDPDAIGEAVGWLVSVVNAPVTIGVTVKRGSQTEGPQQARGAAQSGQADTPQSHAHPSGAPQARPARPGRQ